MTNKITLCIAVFAIVLGQACSKNSEGEISEYKEEGSFTGDHETFVKSDGKFLCDFQWTQGPKEWNYDKASGDNPVNEKDKANEPWCLIPYGDSTEFFVSAKSDESVKDYVCRDLSAQYSLKNEKIINITASLGDGEYVFPYEAHKQMMCVPISSVVATAKNPGGNLKKETLYHVWINADGLYNIAGHINILLVKPVHLSVLWETIVNVGMINGMKAVNLDIPKIKEDWKKYMLKVGYYIDIETVPIVFPNIMEKISGVDDNALTLPSEKDILELPDNFEKWYNGTTSVFELISGLFGEHPNFSKVKRVNYIIATTPEYNIKYDVQKLTFLETKKDTVKTPTGTKIVSKGNCSIFAKNLDYLKNIKDMPNAPLVDYYSKTNVKLGTSISGVAIFEISKEDCDNVSYASGTNYGSEPQAFGINKGYVLSDKDFFKSKNIGRLLAALLYSKIRGIKYPINKDNGRWLSSYFDDGDVEQPKSHWETRENGSEEEQQILLEFASIMQYLKGE